MAGIEDVLKSTEQLLRTTTPSLDAGELRSFVASFLERREIFLDVARRQGSPLYVLERHLLAERARKFKAAFRNHLDEVECYYAVKSNNLPAVAEVLLKADYGLDVSSGDELNQALQLNAKKIIFSGPGKTIAELRLAAAHPDRVIVLMDSFGELDKLEAAAREAGVTMRAGVRLTTQENGLWRKFGIPLSELSRLWTRARECEHVSLCGLQFHSSWNLNPANQIAFLARLGKTLAELNESFCRAIEFLDIGGGFWPSQGEWMIPAGTPAGRLHSLVTESPGEPLVHYRNESTSIDVFASQISGALRTHIFPYLSCKIFLEPGRWICNDAMHILLEVVDKKAADLVITDAGTNAVGWERFESDYFPVINLTRPGMTEHACHILGSLCTPHDVWGYAYFGESIEPGDILLIPTQGAYTYSLRQRFIKPLPTVAILDA